MRPGAFKVPGVVGGAPSAWSSAPSEIAPTRRAPKTAIPGAGSIVRPAAPTASMPKRHVGAVGSAGAASRSRSSTARAAARGSGGDGAGGGGGGGGDGSTGGGSGGGDGGADGGGTSTTGGGAIDASSAMLIARATAPKSSVHPFSSEVISRD